jgi:hypothetical protein
MKYIRNSMAYTQTLYAKLKNDSTNIENKI